MTAALFLSVEMEPSFATGTAGPPASNSVAAAMPTKTLHAHRAQESFWMSEIIHLHGGLPSASHTLYGGWHHHGFKGHL
jgi:hypothetical protein